MIYYFIAYYGDTAQCYDAEKDRFVPYYNRLYRTKTADRDTAQAIARRAKHKHPDKRKNIFIDSYITQ